MPELSRFFGIVISMYSEIHTRHHQPHFHAYYQESSASIGFDPVEVLAGDLPRTQRRLVEAWAELHRDELIMNWRALQAGQPATPIEPLR
jgi:hypothetical protein